MSKTETQSKAESLAKMLEFGAFSPNLLQNEIGVRKGAAAELRRLDAENKALREAWRVLEEDLEYVGGGEYALLVSERQKFREVLERIDSQAAAKTGDAA